MKTIEEIQAILTRPFAVSEIRWRVGQAFVRRDHNPEQGERARGRVLVYANWVPYADRLDEAVGINGWQTLCGMSADGKSFSVKLKLLIDGVWISKSDVAGETDVEGSKGGATDAFKRACAKFGLGRGLYRMGETVANLYYKGRNWIIPDEEIARLNQEYAKAMGLTSPPAVPDEPGREPPVISREQVKAAFTKLVQRIGEDAAMARLAKIKDSLGDFDQCSLENRLNYLTQLES